MKPFEERYTAWVDGRLDGTALASFEQELSRRADGVEARTDKAAAGQLRTLLRENLQAPALTNGEFFSLQIRERIDAERASSRRSAPAEGPSWLAWFATPATRLVGLGAVGLFVAGALYYGMMPPHGSSLAPAVSVAKATVAPQSVVSTDQQLAATAAIPTARGPRSGDDLMAKNDTPAPEDIDDESPGFAARVPDPATTSATATPLHYKDANVNVLWINGLDYMPTVPDSQAGAPQSAPPAPAPTDAHHG